MPKVKNAAAKRLADNIYHAIHLVPEDGTGLSAHAIWDLKQLMRNLNIRDDLTAQEVMALACILAQANDRKLRLDGRQPTGGPGCPTVSVGLERPPLDLVV